MEYKKTLAKELAVKAAKCLGLCPSDQLYIESLLLYYHNELLEAAIRNERLARIRVEREVCKP
jgi:hypothetical protein